LKVQELNDLEEPRGRGFGEDELRYTRERIAEKYTVCQLLYWYRSNELWKSVREEEQLRQTRHAHPLPKTARGYGTRQEAQCERLSML